MFCVWGSPQPEELALKGHSSRDVENHSDCKPEWSVVTLITRAPGASDLFLCSEMENASVYFFSVGTVFSPMVRGGLRKQGSPPPTTISVHGGCDFQCCGLTDGRAQTVYIYGAWEKYLVLFKETPYLLNNCIYLTFQEPSD